MTTGVACLLQQGMLARTSLVWQALSLASKQDVQQSPASAHWQWDSCARAPVARSGSRKRRQRREPCGYPFASSQEDIQARLSRGHAPIQREHWSRWDQRDEGVMTLTQILIPPPETPFDDCVLGSQVCAWHLTADSTPFALLAFPLR